MNKYASTISYPLSIPPDIRTTKTVGTGQVIDVKAIDGDILSDSFNISTGDRLCYGTFTAQSSSPQLELEQGREYDILLLSRYESLVVVRWKLSAPVDPLTREWLRSIDGSIINKGSAKGILRGDKIEINASRLAARADRIENFGGLGFEITVYRSHPVTSTVATFSCPVPTPENYKTPAKVHSISPPNVEWPVMPIFCDSQEPKPKLLDGAEITGSIQVAVRRRKGDEYFIMVCPDGVVRRISAVTNWLEERDYNVPIQSFIDMDYVNLPGNLWFNRQSGRVLWTLMASGRPEVDPYHWRVQG